MMIFKLPGIGVAAVLGSVELAGAALALADAEALGDAALAVGDPLSSTNVVELSPPHPAIAADDSTTNRTTPNPFNTLTGRAHYSSRA
jgi:hypothetical protein